MEFKDKIYELRTVKNMSQERLADEIGVSRQAVAKWENGESYPDVNNLVSISNLFSISLDRLLKNDNCIESLSSNDLKSDSLIEFLVKAKKNTYAGNGKKEDVSCRSQSNDLIYEEGKYKYFDSYFGGERFIGEEVLFVADKPVWAMNYSGVEFNENFSGTFLKKALLNVPMNKPFRGPELFQEGDYLYICKSEGDFGFFSGKEEIYLGDEKVFECLFHGGIIK